MANFSIKFFTTLIYFGAIFLPGFFSHPDTGFPGPYLTGDPVKFYETDPITKQVVSYDIVPFSSSTSSHSRDKRQITLPPDEADKAALGKLGATKKPTEIELKATTQASQPWLNKNDGSPAIGQSTSTRVTVSSVSSKERVVNVVPVPVPLPTSESQLTLANPNNSPILPIANASIDVGEDHIGNVNPTKVSLEDLNLNPFENITNRDWWNKYNYSDVQLNETHKYYNSTNLPNSEYLWMDLDKQNGTEHPMLAKAHRRAATVKLAFEFPFYGHSITNVTVATGGFVYLGDQVHAWLAATQYVAPLMANFDSSVSENSTILYLSNDQFFTVEWRKVHLQDSQENGPFTFQTTLHKNGTIVFAYKEIPISIHDINDTMHPVKVGLSDAYIRDRTMLFVKQKTIYEYDRIDVKTYSSYKIENGSSIVFTPRATCPSFKSCSECTRAETEQFDCAWCPSLKRCSDGTDRGRQDWIQKGCDKEHQSVRHSLECGLTWPTTPTSTYQTSFNDPHHNSLADESHRSETSPVIKAKVPEAEGMGAAGVIGVLFLVMIVLAGVGWAFYAYLYPHSPSGQFLIRYRPTQWAFRRGEARYTAASIHM